MSAGLEHITRSFFLTKTGLFTLITPVIISGIIYIIFQWLYLQQIYDALFVGLLFGSSIVLVYGMYMLGNHLVQKSPAFFLAAIIDSKKKEAAQIHADFISIIFDTKLMAICGIVYGLIVAGAPLVLGLWDDHLLLQLNLSIFLFFVNLITGAAIYSLVRFIEKMYRITPAIHIDLWQSNSDKTDFLLGMTRKMTVLASIYISLSMMSLMFSVFPLHPLVISYAIFAGLLFVAVLLVSPAPVVSKLKKAKMTALSELDTRINQIFSTSADSHKQLDNSEDLIKLRNLFELREKIESMNTWPFKTKSLIAAFYIAFFSSLPVLIGEILGRFFSE
jgi:hypothetical protein